MQTDELFELLERCSKLSIRGNTKAIRQATDMQARITELETAGRNILESHIEKTVNLSDGSKIVTWENGNTAYDVESKYFRDAALNKLAAILKG